MTKTNSGSIQRVAVIGGGVTGLAAAHRLTELNPALSLTLFESGDRLGGVVQSLERDGYLIERAADMFITKEPWAVDLCRRIGFEDQLVETNEEMRRAFVVRRGKLQPVPDGFTLMTPVKIWPVVSTPILSPLGKLRLAYEFFVPPKRDNVDESLDSFATRRMGREAYERLVQPLISSIYTADPKKLSMRASMPQFFGMEQKHGSLARGMRRLAKARRSDAQGTGARYGLFVSARHGLGTLVDAIAARLPAGSVRLKCSIQELAAHVEGGWDLLPEGAEQPERFDAVIVATPASRAASLLARVDEPLSSSLRDVPYAGTVILAAGFRRDQFSHPLDGFGYVVPIIEKRRVLSVSFSSVKFSGRAPEDCVLLRVFVGGACQAELLDLDDHALQQLVEEELQEVLGLRGKPQFFEPFRWPDAMPQYHVGHLQRTEEIEQRAAALPNFALAGNAYHGVGIPFCIHSGEQAAERICGDLGTAPYRRS
ncbi:MAG: protoporphyrinogen oxidase [Pirellulaceae bacterium]